VADGAIAPEERRYLEAVAGEIGVSVADVDQRLKAALAAG
jgi:tellurite resistance protein